MGFSGLGTNGLAVSVSVELRIHIEPRSYLQKRPLQFRNTRGRFYWCVQRASFLPDANTMEIRYPSV